MEDYLVKFKVILCIFTLFLACFNLKNTVLAQENSFDIMIAPHTFELNVKKGEKLEKTIKILNKGSVDIPMKAKAVDFTAEDGTGKMVFGTDNGDVSPASWIEIKRPDFILNPGETYVLNFEIKIPENVVPGGYYATVIFEPQLPSVYFEKNKPRAIPEIGALILFAVEIEGMERSDRIMSVAKFSIPEKYHLEKLENAIGMIIGMPSEAAASKKGGFSIVENSKLSFDVQIENGDIFHDKFFGKLEVISNDGKRILGETEVMKTTILPKKTRSFPVEFDSGPLAGFWGDLPFGISDFIKDNLTWGKYEARLTLFQEDPVGLSASSGSRAKATEEIIEFWIFPWKSFIILTVASVMLFIARKRLISALLALRNARWNG